NLGGLLCIMPLTVLFAPVGASLAAKLDAAKLKKIFAVVLLITGLRMLVQLFL
ncbi:MAG: sulfite exporter TauE/SafE family protein, partial [Bacteroidota bacterium]